MVKVQQRYLCVWRRVECCYSVERAAEDGGEGGCLGARNCERACMLAQQCNTYGWSSSCWSAMVIVGTLQTESLHVGASTKSDCTNCSSYYHLRSKGKIVVQFTTANLEPLPSRIMPSRLLEHFVSVIVAFDVQKKS